MYADNGTYAVTLLVTDALGGTSTATTSVVVANVAPMLPTFSGAMLFPGETYATTGTFLDPGADTYTATVDYGTGSGEQPLTVGGFSFALSHVYTSAGTFTVTVRVRDDDGGVGTRSATVTVNTVAQGIAMLSDVIDALAQAGAINKGNANALSASLRNAAKQIARDGTTPAKNMLGAFINKVQAFERSSRFTEQQADELIALAERLIRSLDTP